MNLFSVNGLQASSLSPVCEVCKAASGVHRNSEETCKSEYEHRFSYSECLSFILIFSFFILLAMPFHTHSYIPTSHLCGRRENVFLNFLNDSVDIMSHLCVLQYVPAYLAYRAIVSVYRQDSGK